MNLDSLSLGAPAWWLPAACLLAAALVALLYSYGRTPASRGVRLGAATLKALGIVLLVLCLLEPLLHDRRPRPGANVFALLVDTSESLRIRDEGEDRERGEVLRELLAGPGGWQERLAEDFNLRRYTFDARLRTVKDTADLTFEGRATRLGASLEAVAHRHRGRPLAGVLLFTDGIATDMDPAEVDTSRLPPIYPVLIGKEGPARDLGVKRVTVSQTQFESAPVTVQAEIVQHGHDGEEVLTRILDASGTEVDRLVERAGDSRRLTARFQLRPEGPGIHFYRVSVSSPEVKNGGEPADDDDDTEATLANNSRLIAVHSDRGPYRVLYVSGRPNWEFKFLRRALQEDEEVELVGLIRIARREPKFDFRSRFGESTNPLYRGFGNQTDDEAEQYDEPVLLRLGTEEEDELLDGFPRAADLLFRYHAVILDDVEAAYFSQDQMDILRRFVSLRGGGFLMLGGRESFARGKYARTPIGEMLPVYLDLLPPSPEGAEYRLMLDREGWIQPWMRLRRTEEGEERRLEEMPPFRVLNPARGIKPGASVLASVRDNDGRKQPALVVQPFGRGRTGALLIGDLWRWSLRRKSDEEGDPETAWRQMVRWLVADVPRRVDAEVEPGAPGSPARVAVRVRSELYEPLDNASVSVSVQGPDGARLELTAEASDQEAGLYEARYTPRQPGGYLARAAVQGPDGAEIGEHGVGWTSEPAAAEYGGLEPDRALLERLARETGGEMVPAGSLPGFVSSLEHRDVPITDPWVRPLWHRWWVLLLVIFCLCGEWALRRWKGLP